MSGSVGNNPYRASGVVASLSAGREGTVDWDTTIHTSTVTAESGTGYFVNTNGGAVQVNLPAASVGDIVGIKDYAGTFQTNACTVAPNGSEKIGGGSDNDPTLTVEGESVLLVYADSTQGWLATQQSVTASPTGTANYLTASGGNQPTASGCVVCTNYKIHKFTSPGTFTVSEVGDAAQNVVSYLVVAGAGGGGGAPNVNAGGSGGAGGFREYKSSADCYTASPLNGNPGGTAVTVSATGYPIVIGAGGAGSCSSSACKGNDSSFAPITSTAGGQGGAMYPSAPTVVGGTGGSGGGAGGGRTGDSGAAGNTPPTTPPQGNPGGPNAPSAPDNSSGGGGGAGGAGGASGCGAGGAGGAHINTSISGADVEYSGGSGGAGHTGAAGTPGGGGSGVAKGTSPSHDATAGTANTGGSGGGSFSGSQGMAGGSGIVYIRYRFQ